MPSAGWFAKQDRADGGAGHGMRLMARPMGKGPCAQHLLNKYPSKTLGLATPAEKINELLKPPPEITN